MPETEWSTAVGETAHGVINVRGYPLADIIEKLSFAEATYLTIRGELPTPEQARLMNAALCAILEHGLYAPTTYAARVVASAAPDSIMPGIAAGMLTIGSITVSPQHSAELIVEMRDLVASGLSQKDAAHQIATRMAEQGQRMPGVGHPLHPEGDPRAISLQKVAEEVGLWTELSGYYYAVRAEFLEKTGRALPVNVDGMLGCVLAELGFTPIEMPGIAAISFMPGVVAHCVEELGVSPKLRIADVEYTGKPTRSLEGSAP